MDCMSGMGAQPWLGQGRAVDGLGYKGHDPAVPGRAFSFVAFGRFLQLIPLGLAWFMKGFSLSHDYLGPI